MRESGAGWEREYERGKEGKRKRNEHFKKTSSGSQSTVQRQVPHSEPAAAVGRGWGAGIPMPQLLHTGRRRGHLNEVLTDIQARSEAELPKKKKKNTQPQRRQSEKVGNAKQRFSTSSGKWKRGV